MNKVTRILTTAGLGLLAGVAFGTGPVQAADTAAPSAAKSQTGATQADRFRDRDAVVGYYRSYRACDLAGRIGERFGRWDDYDCDFQRRGFHRGQFALEVERNWGWGRPGHHRFDDRGDHNRGPHRRG
ncbi:hypothetical protein M1L60_23680 [Actinoplanes sp. TRM 88003]|uniref:Uncharacterized protein n=1 Tax=Paractinoplanes aksuensis TaxID=2939490 RepID=A0ABT1DRY7_9ACTN|nr:hypothetical protein [Actinoplanes aksuensis]MCO8273599.1 hypothetical protein [Actinoplanes aksuensis]